MRMSFFCCTFAADFEKIGLMSAQLAEQVNYDVIRSSELPHYMTLDEMHERLTAKIHEFSSFRRDGCIG